MTTTPTIDSAHKDNRQALPYPTKKINMSVKDVDMDKRTVAGYFSVFGNKDSDGDIIQKGAYKKTVKENGPNGKNRIVHLLQHNPTQPLGKPETLKEDDNGLFFQTKISDTSYGTDTLKLYRDEVLQEHSVGFKVINSSNSHEDDARVLTELKLFEGSTVTWGANELAQGSVMKGDDYEDIVDRYNQLQKAYYRGDYTDDTFRLIEQQKDFLEHLLHKALADTEEPEPTTPSSSRAAKIEQLFDKTNRSLKLTRSINHVQRQRKRSRRRKG